MIYKSLPEQPLWQDICIGQTVSRIENTDKQKSEKLILFIQILPKGGGGSSS